MRKFKVKGFTLIELIVVIAIIGVLATILIPTMMGYIKKSKRASDVSSARGIHVAALDLILEDDEANNSFYDNNSASIASATKQSDVFSNSDYNLVLVAYLDGKSTADGSGNIWKETDPVHKEFCDKLNMRMEYNASSSNIKLKIKSNGSNSTQKFNRWFIGYRKETPSTVEIWVGDGSSSPGTPEMCLYTQINNSTTASDG